MEAYETDDTIITDEPANGVDLVNVFRSYTQREKDEWHAFQDNFVNRMWQDYQFIPPKPQRKNNVFNAEMDELLLELMPEQVAMGRKGDMGFKDEAYVAVANVMTAANKFGRVLTEGTIRNHCKNLKKQYVICTELLYAPVFGFDNSMKHIGHPNAHSWRSRTIDYNKLSLVFGRDVATGQFARSSQNVMLVNDSQS
ncbi:hypothetical protein AAC387_Pa01g2535 [Persea americana]